MVYFFGVSHRIKPDKSLNFDVTHKTRRFSVAIGICEKTVIGDMRSVIRISEFRKDVSSPYKVYRSGISVEIEASREGITTPETEPEKLVGADKQVSA